MLIKAAQKVQLEVGTPPKTAALLIADAMQF
jgi:hypothetical protein